MKLYEPFSILIVGIVCVALAATGYASWKYFGMPQDNVVEETMEEVVDDMTGVDADLSPDTPEVCPEFKKQMATEK